MFTTGLLAAVEIAKAVRSRELSAIEVVDGYLARIARLNGKLNAVVYHNQVVSQLEKIFADDLTYSRRLSLEQWRNRAGLNRLLELLSLPVRPQL